MSLSDTILKKNLNISMTNTSVEVWEFSFVGSQIFPYPGWEGSFLQVAVPFLKKRIDYTATSFFFFLVPRTNVEQCIKKCIQQNLTVIIIQEDSQNKYIREERPTSMGKAKSCTSDRLVLGRLLLELI